MESIDVLRDQPECIGPATFKLNKSDVRRIRLFRGNQFTSPVVPFPDQLWIPFKGFWGCKILCAKVAPQAVSPAKSRHAAIRRNAGSREDGDVSSGREVCPGEEDLIVFRHGRMG